jgi:3-hydroxy-9,10-secoandrosta-1,3,5(10)-triene-9,17-dione monooxygenase reductase component
MGATLLDQRRISPDLVRQALGHFATGVTVITTRGSDGVPVGTTASAVSSLSLVPPLLLVCLDRTSETLAAIQQQRAFAINVLAESQGTLSANFARRGTAASWDDVGHRPGPTGTPHLHGTIAVLDCRLERFLDGGDHQIVIGRLVALTRSDQDLRPLLHYQGNYASLRAV